MSVTSIADSSRKSKPPQLPRLDHERGLCRKSKRLPFPDALRLAKRLANLSNILQPEIVGRRINAKGDTALVQWQPVKHGSTENDLAAFLASRTARAVEQDAVMTFVPMQNRPDGYLVVNEDYHGSLKHFLYADCCECECEDWRYRCARLAELSGHPIPCHHLIALANRLQNNLPLEAACLATREPEPVPAYLSHPLPTETTQERRTRIETNIARDFA